eukprot:scaffold7330_cov119-Skeletonema_dohrnii-CCMP3373.AAC.1
MAELHAEIETLIIRSAEIQRRSKFKLCKHNCNVQAFEESYHHYLEEIREHEKTIDWLNEAVVRCHLYDEEILMGRRLAVVDNSTIVETTRSLATEFSELCSRKRLG